MTHINAFYQEVQEKEEAVKQAEAELQGAKQRLETHPDYEAPKEKKSQEVTRSAKNGQFVNESEATKSPDTTVTEKVASKTKKK